MSNPLIYELNGRIWLKSIKKKYGKPLDLAHIPEDEIQAFKELHLDYLWLMGIWQTGKKSLTVSRDHPALQQEYRAALPDLKESDISGSPYAVAGYKPAKVFGSVQGLKKFRERLHTAGIKLILDFIPNHTGLDHPWLQQHPDYYMQDNKIDAYYKDHYQKTGFKIAHGRDPYFAPWTDTLQLDYTNRDLREKEVATLRGLAQVCDGVRCDMAMLVTNDIIKQTWGRKPDEEFWPKAIAAVKKNHPDFIFMAEVYWNMERQLQQMGFDYTYDKRLYDLLHAASVSAITAHLQADPVFQEKSIHFIENHDEVRAVVQFGRNKSMAAATAIYTIPGMRFLHHVQQTGRRIKIPVQLTRMPEEAEDEQLMHYYQRLLAITSQDVFKSGQWHLEPCPDNQILYWSWRLNRTYKMVVINYSDQTVETNLPLPTGYPIDTDIIFTDELTDAAYLHRKENLLAFGLYIKLAPYQSHLFAMQPVDKRSK
jgi:hypothetical protein